MNREIDSAALTGLPEGTSRPVRSAQVAVHPALEDVVRRHLDTPWRQPLHAPSVEAFKAVLGLMEPRDSGRLVLDAGCGTGDSTARLAGIYGEALVIGIDQSADRLARAGVCNAPLRQDNRILVRAELSTFWRLACQAGWRLQGHYLLYPNPWPKRAHLRRRWQGHPVFPDLLALGGRLVLRTNWKIYAAEFSRALSIARGLNARVRVLDPVDGLSPFERKYARSGHTLYEVVAELAQSGTTAAAGESPVRPAHCPTTSAR